MGVYLGSQAKGTVRHPGRDDRVTGTGGSRMCCVHDQEAETDAQLIHFSVYSPVP